MSRIYIGTKRIAGSGTSNIIYIDKAWNFVKNDLLEVSVYHIDRPKKVFTMTKKVCRVGNAVGIFCDSSCGFSHGDMVVFSAQKIGVVRDDNAGSSTESKD